MRRVPGLLLIVALLITSVPVSAFCCAEPMGCCPGSVQAHATRPAGIATADRGCCEPTLGLDSSAPLARVAPSWQGFEVALLPAPIPGTVAEISAPYPIAPDAAFRSAPPPRSRTGRAPPLA